MTTPTITSDEFTGYLDAPVLRNGGSQHVIASATIPASTASGTVIGLVPFRKGARLSYSSKLVVGDLDTATNVTIDFGYVYDDNTTYTNDPNAFIAGSTDAQTAANVVSLDATAGFEFVAEADGWLAITTGGGSTTTEGTIKFNGLISYNG